MMIALIMVEKVVKADFSGGKISVIRSKNESMVGIGGLVIKETARTFIVMGADNKVRIILK